MWGSLIKVLEIGTRRDIISFESELLLAQDKFPLQWLAKANKLSIGKIFKLWIQGWSLAFT